MKSSGLFELEAQGISKEELREELRLRQAYAAIKQLLATQDGRVFMMYLLREFEYGEMPQVGMDKDLMLDKMGMLRAGQAIFNLIAEADPYGAAALLGEIKKEDNDVKNIPDDPKTTNS